MGRPLRARAVRAFGRLTGRIWLVAGVLATAAVLVAPSSALAESGEPCKEAYLTVNAICYNTAGHHTSFVETESWNSIGLGYGSCTGVLGLHSNKEVYIKAEKCVGNYVGYDEVYCTTNCKGKEGYGYVWNRVSGGPSEFTVWADWS